MQIRGYQVDHGVISKDEARRYIERYGERFHPRRIQAWFDHCARIRRVIATAVFPSIEDDGSY